MKRKKGNTTTKTAQRQSALSPSLGALGAFTMTDRFFLFMMPLALSEAPLGCCFGQGHS
jgi:hypothetical protein